MLRKTTIAVTVAVLSVCAGCENHAHNKNAAKERWNKASAQMRLAVAEQQYRERDYEEAANTVRQCLAADPNNPAAHMLYGKLLLGSGQQNKATLHFKHALMIDATLAEVWYWLGVVEQQERDYQNAYVNYEMAMSLAPSKVDYVLAVAEVQIARNNNAEAAALLDDKMNMLPADVSLKVAAGNLMCRLGKNKRAIELYKQAMLLTSDDAGITEALGYCYMFDVQWVKAAKIFNQLKKKCPDEAKKKLYLEAAALCSMNSAQYASAVNYYSELSFEDRDNAETWLRMGRAALGTGQVSKALNCGRRALSLQPGWADAIALIGCAQYASGHYKTASVNFERIATDGDLGGFSWLMRARCYEQLGKKNEAERAYAKAFEMNPHSDLASFLAKYKGVEDR